MAVDITVFIVDDDQDDRDMFCEVVKEINERINCKVFSNGQEALQVLQKHEVLPNFIFLDLNMPRMNGKQFLTNIKNMPCLCSIPVIIYSTSKLDEDKEETKKLGAEYFLTKPTSMQQLKKELESVFAKKISLAGFNGSKYMNS